MPKAQIRGNELTVRIPAKIRKELALRDGDELKVSVENSRIVLSLLAEAPLPGEMEALDEAEAELAAGLTHQLDDVLNGLERKIKQPRKTRT